jgi:hypothetical protein
MKAIVNANIARGRFVRNRVRKSPTESERTVWRIKYATVLYEWRFESRFVPFVACQYSGFCCPCWCEQLTPVFWRGDNSAALAHQKPSNNEFMVPLRIYRLQAFFSVTCGESSGHVGNVSSFPVNARTKSSLMVCLQQLGGIVRGWIDKGQTAKMNKMQGVRVGCRSFQIRSGFSGMATRQAISLNSRTV